MPKWLSAPRLLVLAAVLAVGLLAPVWWGRNPAPVVRVAEARRAALVVEVATNGKVEPVEDMEIRARFGGRILSIPDAGKKVRRGDEVLRIDAGPVSAELRAHYAPKQRALALDGRSRDNLYARASLSSAIPGTPLTLDAHVGRDFGRSSLNLATRYTEWGLGVRYVRGPVTLGLAYADTDRAVRTQRGRNLGGAGLIASASFGF